MIATMRKFKPMSSDKRKKSAADLRRDWQTMELLREYEEMLTNAATRMSEQRKEIEAAGLKEIHCDGVKKFTNGYELIDGYLKNLAKAMIDAGIR